MLTMSLTRRFLPSWNYCHGKKDWEEILTTNGAKNVLKTLEFFATASWKIGPANLLDERCGVGGKGPRGTSPTLVRGRSFSRNDRGLVIEDTNAPKYHRNAGPRRDWQSRIEVRALLAEPTIRYQIQYPPNDCAHPPLFSC